MANYTKTTIGKENRVELHEKLSLTGAEISLNERIRQITRLPKKVSPPDRGGES